MVVGVALEGDGAVGPEGVAVTDESSKPEEEIEEIESDKEERCLLPEMDGLVTEFDFREGTTVVEDKREERDGMEITGRETAGVDEEGAHGEEIICSWHWRGRRWRR